MSDWWFMTACDKSCLRSRAGCESNRPRANGSESMGQRQGRQPTKRRRDSAPDTGLGRAIPGMGEVHGLYSPKIPDLVNPSDLPTEALRELD
ncbi:hypothetical protein SARC_02866 [Sphaeroforma arctica JP610]|uniref:Uncharacterized protein n=1 Tax=Sphaeroforma arctica JP610 TaxID=667725 RepID=A0A0L0G7P6_9EUKA|nr:hypothetical protein SARC_02866 [Sphaeroforma arctica JP610]KNC84944.1 hypothetical protein SARC_02866 [Sphaeroforma arctica JP610]|eukprot:XP_014158846.1 hypothetical protein SARC_02866 [Sphaeroforma arctica JP610]